MVQKTILHCLEARQNPAHPTSCAAWLSIAGSYRPSLFLSDVALSVTSPIFGSLALILSQNGTVAVMCPDDGPTAMSADRSRLTMQGPDPVDPSPVLRHILSRAATRSIIATKHKLHACRNLQSHSSPWTRRLFAVLMQIKDTQASWLEAGTKSPGAHAVKFSSWKVFP